MDNPFLMLIKTYGMMYVYNVLIKWQNIIYYYFSIIQDYFVKLKCCTFQTKLDKKYIYFLNIPQPSAIEE